MAPGALRYAVGPIQLGGVLNNGPHQRHAHPWDAERSADIEEQIRSVGNPNPRAAM
jgi:hypothetical protein